MPKLPRDVSHDRMVVRQGGRHTLVSNGLAEVAIPRHGVLKTGTVAAILDQTETPAEAWPDL